jgi:hypothetical protein
MPDRVFGTLIDQNNSGQYNVRQQGVFAMHPLATPKYAKNRGLRDGEFRDTLARLYISLADASDAVRNAYLASLPGDAATQALAAVLLGANSKGGTGFVDFFLTSANESFQEIMQVDKVMADDYVAFFYGQQPPQFQYSGTLLNSLQDDQRGGFARAYQQMLRGTQLARRGALARLRYDSVIVSGVLFAHQQQLIAENEMAVPFSFSFLVKEYIVITNLPFAKLTPQAYVKLAADSALAALQPVGTVQSAQVKATMVPPPVLSNVSTAGSEENKNVVNQDQNKLQQTEAKARAATAPTSVTSNIRGTVNPIPPTPPPAP